jgi:hypothetical protein
MNISRVCVGCERRHFPRPGPLGVSSLVLRLVLFPERLVEVCRLDNEQEFGLDDLVQVGVALCVDGAVAAILGQ